MKFIVLTLLVIAVYVGCDSKSSKSTTEVTQGTVYKGQHEGCIVRYNDLFCPPRYKTGSLTAGEPVYIRDKNGSMVILDIVHDKVKPSTQVYYKMEGDK